MPNSTSFITASFVFLLSGFHSSNADIELVPSLLSELEECTMFQAEASGRLFNAAPDSSLRFQSDTEVGQMYRLLDDVQEESLFLLQDFSAQEDFASKMASVFGEGNDYGDWRTAFASGSFVDFPTIKIVSGALPKRSNAAYAGSLNTIYFSENFLKQYSDDTQTLVSVFVEELGHYVDWKVNEVDTPGDEGELFSAVVRKANIAPQQLERLKQENDSMLIYDHRTILGNTLGKISFENSHSGYVWNVGSVFQAVTFQRSAKAIKETATRQGSRQRQTLEHIAWLGIGI